MQTLRQGKHYYWEIMLPGGLLGIIVGFATQRHVPRQVTQEAR